MVTRGFAVCHVGLSPVDGFAVAQDEALAEFVNLTFTVGSDMYRVRRPGAVWSADYCEEPLEHSKRQRSSGAPLRRTARTFRWCVSWTSRKHSSVDSADR